MARPLPPSPAAIAPPPDPLDRAFDALKLCFKQAREQRMPTDQEIDDVLDPIVEAVTGRVLAKLAREPRASRLPAPAAASKAPGEGSESA